MSQFIIHGQKNGSGELDLVAHVSSMIQEAEAGGSLAQGMLWIQSNFKARLGHLEIPHLNIKPIEWLKT